MDEPIRAREIENGAAGLLALTDWRRRIADLYRDAREAPASDASWAAWRTGRDELFRTHDASPVPADRRSSYLSTPFFAYDPAARVTAVVRDAEPEIVDIAGSHGTFGATRFAAADFAIHGTACSLDLFWLEGYAGGLFVAFGDPSNGATSYGGGRYLLDTVKGADLGAEEGGLVLDFNFAYNPSCAYDPGWACPLAPPTDRLDLAIEAGERRPA